jgi:hypothetical protein
MQRFSGWSQGSRIGEREVDGHELCYLWDDFLVRRSPIRRDTVLFEAITPEWLAFCKEQLQFEVDTTVASLLEAKQARESSSVQAEEVFFTPGQIWSIEEINSVHEFYGNIAVALPLSIPDPVPMLDRIFAYLAHYHDALRLHIERVGDRWHQLLTDAYATPPLTWVYATHLAEDEQKKVIDALSLEMQEQLNTLQEYLWHIAYCETSTTRKGTFLFTINHLIYDGVSNDILFRDMSTLIYQALQGKELRLPPKTSSLQQWTRRIAEYLHTSEAREEIQNYWLALPWNKVKAFPLDFPEGCFFDPQSLRTGYGTRASDRVITLELGKTYTQKLLTRVANRYTQPLDLFLTAIALTLTAWSHSSVLAILVQDHARRTMFSDIDLLRTIGFIAHARRLCLDLTATSSPLEALEAVKKQLRQAPNNSHTLEWFWRRGDGKETPEALKRIPEPQIHLNVHGNIYDYDKTRKGLDNFFQPPLLDYPHALRNLVFNCDVLPSRGDVLFTWSYSNSIHRSTTIELLTQQFIETLRDLITLLTPESL